MHDQKHYWFPAKRFGWGWGLPTAWQGWIVLGLFFFMVGVGAFALLPSHGPNTFLAWCATLCLVLVVVCWLKGEPPRWRWGKK